MDKQYRLLYPERRTVNGSRLILWAADARANGHTEECASTAEDAIRILEDLGQITVDRSTITDRLSNVAY